MIRIAICDDEKIILDYVYNQIKSITDNLNKEIEIQTFLDGDKMLSESTKNFSSFNILFLDIDMPISTGFEIAEFIRKYNKSLILIFLTSMEDKVYESFKYNPFRFIRKQKLDEELQEVLYSAVDLVEKNIKKEYMFKTESGEVKLNISDILYIECLNRKVYLKTNSKEYCLLGIQFNEIVNEFSSKGFVLVHRTCIVNLKYIYSIGKIDIVLDNGEILPMSRYKRNIVKKAFTLYAR